MLNVAIGTPSTDAPVAHHVTCRLRTRSTRLIVMIGLGSVIGPLSIARLCFTPGRGKASRVLAFIIHAAK